MIENVMAILKRPLARTPIAALAAVFLALTVAGPAFSASAKDPKSEKRLDEVVRALDKGREKARDLKVKADKIEQDLAVLRRDMVAAAAMTSASPFSWGRMAAQRVSVATRRRLRSGARRTAWERLRPARSRQLSVPGRSRIAGAPLPTRDSTPPWDTSTASTSR